MNCMHVTKIHMILTVDGQNLAPAKTTVTSATLFTRLPDPPRPPPNLILEHVLAKWKLWTDGVNKKTDTTLVDHNIDHEGRGDRSEMRKRNETPNNKCVKRKHLRGGAIFCPSTVSQTQVLHPPRTIHVTTQTLYTLVRTLFDPSEIWTPAPRGTLPLRLALEFFWRESSVQGTSTPLPPEGGSRPRFIAEPAPFRRCSIPEGPPWRLDIC